MVKLVSYLFGILVALFLGMLIGSVIRGDVNIHINSKPSKHQQYKAYQTESETILYIKDSIHIYKPGDAVWVNMNTQYVDNIDSTAMKCIIVEAINR